MLYEEDGGDLEKRQSRIERFVDETNKLLEKYERGKWKYKQDFRSVLAYLVFFKPEENYLYKASQCQPFFRYMEYGEEIGYGQYFKLSKYYRMCDALRTELYKNDDLMKKHESRWLKVGNPQDQLHILTFDIIYCSIVYDFYEYKEYQKIVKKNKKDIEREKIENSIDIKQDRIEELERILCEKSKKLDILPEIEIDGLVVKHKMFGFGKVTKQYGTYIDVEFKNRESKFIFTTAFVNGILSSEDDSILERCKTIESVLTECKRIENLIKMEQCEMNSLMLKL